MSDKPPKVMFQKAPWPYELVDAVTELTPRGELTGWVFYLEEENRGQGCNGLTLSIVPNVQNSYRPEEHARTRFLYPVPAAAFNRESWEEWIWEKIAETQDHERSEGFVFTRPDGTEYRPFKPAHADGWNPGFVRAVVSDTVVNTPNAGRLVKFPCYVCTHFHHGKMGENFTIVEDRGCIEENCCGPIT